MQLKIQTELFKTLTSENEKPNMNAILILSEIIRCIKKSGENTIHYQYKHFEEIFNLTRNQSKPAFKFLISKKIISIEFRTIKINGLDSNNNMFITLHPEVIKLYIEKNSELYIKKNKEWRDRNGLSNVYEIYE